MTTTSTHTSIITLNNNSLNCPDKRQRLAEWLEKLKSSTCCIKQTHLNFRIKEWTKILQSNASRKQASVTIQICDKVDFKVKLMRRSRGSSSMEQ